MDPRLDRHIHELDGERAYCGERHTGKPGLGELKTTLWWPKKTRRCEVGMLAILAVLVVSCSGSQDGVGPSTTVSAASRITERFCQDLAGISVPGTWASAGAPSDGRHGQDFTEQIPLRSPDAPFCGRWFTIETGSPRGEVTITVTLSQLGSPEEASAMIGRFKHLLHLLQGAGGSESFSSPSRAARESDGFFALYTDVPNLTSAQVLVRLIGEEPGPTVVLTVWARSTGGIEKLRSLVERATIERVGADLAARVLAD